MPVMTSWCVRTIHCWSRIRSETCSSVTLKKRRRRCWRQRRWPIKPSVSPTELVSPSEPCPSLENLVALWLKIWAGEVVDSNLTRDLCFCTWLNLRLLQEDVEYVTLKHKTSLKSLGNICSNRQQYSVWVKMIDFYFMPKIDRSIDKIPDVAKTKVSKPKRYSLSKLRLCHAPKTAHSDTPITARSRGAEGAAAGVLPKKKWGCWECCVKK